MDRIDWTVNYAENISQELFDLVYSIPERCQPMLAIRKGYKWYKFLFVRYRYYRTYTTSKSIIYRILLNNLG